nr:hypothetical protein [Burkholderia lata]
MNKLNAMRLGANDCRQLFFVDKVPERGGMGYRRFGRWLANRMGAAGNGRCGGNPRSGNRQLDGADPKRRENMLVHGRATERLEVMPPSTVTMVPLV